MLSSGYDGRSFSNQHTDPRRSLESEFRDKYDHLRSVYEKRIKELSDVVVDACQNLMHDEVISELKRDSIGISFVPAHIRELFANHLTSERERFLLDLSESISKLQIDKSKLAGVINSQKSKIDSLEPEVVQLRRTALALDPLKERLVQLQSEFEALATKSDVEVSALIEDRDKWKANSQSLQDQSKALSIRLDQLTNSLKVSDDESRNNRTEISSLNHTIEFLRADLKASAVSIDDKSNRLAELQQLTNKLGEENKVLLANFLESKSLHQLASEELSRTKDALQKKGIEEGECTRKLASLMSHVEGILQTESQESNDAIAAVHEKMKTLRHRFITELQKEKRVIAALESELVDARRSRDEASRESHTLNIEINVLRGQAKRDQDLINALHIDVDKMKAKILDRESKLNRADEKIIELEKNRDRDWKLLEHKLKLECQESVQQEIIQAREREALLKQRYDNELSVLHSRQLRSSMSGDVSTSLLGMQSQSQSQAVGYPPVVVAPMPYTTPYNNNNNASLHGSREGIMQYSSNQSYYGFGPSNRSTDIPNQQQQQQQQGGGGGYPGPDSSGSIQSNNERISELQSHREQLQKHVSQLQGRLAEASEHINTLRGMVIALQQYKKMHETSCPLNPLNGHQLYSGSSDKSITQSDVSTSQRNDVSQNSLSNKDSIPKHVPSKPSTSSLSQVTNNRSHRYDGHASAGVNAVPDQMRQNQRLSMNNHPVGSVVNRRSRLPSDEDMESCEDNFGTQNDVDEVEDIENVSSLLFHESDHHVNARSQGINTSGK